MIMILTSWKFKKKKSFWDWFDFPKKSQDLFSLLFDFLQNSLLNLISQIIAYSRKNSWRISKKKNFFFFISLIPIKVEEKILN